MTAKNRKLFPILTLVLVLPLLGAPACGAQESTVEGGAGEELK